MEFHGTDGPVDNPADSTQQHRVVWKTPTAADALKAIYQIAVQGEGTEMLDTPASKDSHFEEFLGLYRDFQAKGGAGRILDVPTDPSSADFPGPAQPWAALFNNRYKTLLMTLSYALSLKKQEPEWTLRRALINHAIRKEMVGPLGIKALSMRLASLPGGKAAPPFELPDDRLPADAAGQKALLIQLLGESSGLIDDILDPGKGANPSDDEKTALNSLATDLAALKQKLEAP